MSVLDQMAADLSPLRVAWKSGETARACIVTIAGRNAILQ